MPCQHAPAGWFHADCGCLAAVRGVILPDQRVTHVSSSQTSRQGLQLGRAFHGQHDGIRPRREPLGRALACGVDDLGGQQAEGEVAADHDVMRQGVGVSEIGGLSYGKGKAAWDFLLIESQHKSNQEESQGSVSVF